MQGATSASRGGPCRESVVEGPMQEGWGSGASMQRGACHVQGFVQGAPCRGGLCRRNMCTGGPLHHTEGPLRCTEGPDCTPRLTESQVKVGSGRCGRQVPTLKDGSSCDAYLECQ